MNELANRITDGRAYLNPTNNIRGTGSWQCCTSELPLIAEFLVRQKQTEILLAALPKAPVRPALTLLLMQIEEMIALDFNLLSDVEYETLSNDVKLLWPKVNELNKMGKIFDVGESNTRYHLLDELPRLQLNHRDVSQSNVPPT